VKQENIDKARLELIRKYGSLFWYVREEDKADLSLEAVVESILNYGDLDAVRLLIKKAGISKVASIFFSQVQRDRVNYFPQVENFFRLYFNRHVHGNIDQKTG
jgi:hypothetical protein